MTAEALAGRHVVVTQSITTSMTGMTYALLNRSSALADAYDVDVEVLLLDQRIPVAEVTAWLRSRDLDHPRVRFTSLWEDLSTRTSVPAGALTPRAVLFRIVRREVRRRLGKIKRSPRSKSAWLALRGTKPKDLVIDGHRAASIRSVTVGRRRLSQPHTVKLFGLRGRSLGRTYGWWPLWSAWLTETLSGPEPVNLICDNWHVVDLLTAWGMPNVATTYVVHSDHTGSRVGDLQGKGWTPGRGYALQRVDSLDACVFLTEQQRMKFIAEHGDPGNLHVVPNSIDLPERNERVERDARRGVAMTRLVAIKRPDHVVAAMAAITDPTIELDIFGGSKGKDQWTALESQIGGDSRVRLRGRTDDPAGEFARASFMVLTSTSEGFGLVIVEAMAQGCIPICYDVRYGPAEIITDGVDGFVVEPDPQALAAAIERFLRLPSEQIEQMRTAARGRAAQFEGARVVRRWPAVLGAAREMRRGRPVQSIEFAELMTVEAAARRWHGV